MVRAIWLALIISGCAGQHGQSPVIGKETPSPYGHTDYCKRNINSSLCK